MVRLGYGVVYHGFVPASNREQLHVFCGCGDDGGYHAGGPMVMDKVVRMAKEWGVAVGAHPGYPDLMGFGRRKMTLSVDEVKNYMQYQIGALMAFTQSYGLKLQHVAPHGALGNLCQYDRETSRAICEAVYEIDPSASSTARGPSWGRKPRRWV